MKGAEVTEGNTPKLQDCDTCAQSKAHRLISRRQRIKERLPAPLSDVSMDIVEYNIAFNGDKYMLYAYDESTRLHFVWSMHSTGQQALVEAYQELRRFVKNLGREIYVISTDNDASIGYIFKSVLRDDNVNLNLSAPYTAAQNPSERAGGLLTTMARCMAIEGNLPEGLWPELVATAAYLLNRSPTRALKYKTPMEAATGQKPSVAHIYKVGSRAYAYKTRKGDLPKRNKLDGRCHIGYLVGFEGHNIYRIWIPSRNEVIRTRDVLFNEQARYEGPLDIDLGTILRDNVRHAAEQELPTSPNYGQFNLLLPFHVEQSMYSQPEGVREPSNRTV